MPVDMVGFYRPDTYALVINSHVTVYLLLLGNVSNLSRHSTCPLSSSAVEATQSVMLHDAGTQISNCQDRNLCFCFHLKGV